MANADPPLSQDAMQRFTATGRPYVEPSAHDKAQNGLVNVGLADTFSAALAPANSLPFRYTDDSLISVPVLRPEDVGKTPTTTTDAKKKFGLFSSRRRSKDGGINENFVIKKVPRREYLKHYAKDDDGKYCGTEEPARDCLLRGPDLEKWRGGASGL